MRLQFLTGDFTVTENLCDEAATDCFATMDGNDCASTVSVTQEMMAAANADDLEPKMTKSPNELSARQCREVAHAVMATR